MSAGDRYACDDPGTFSRAGDNVEFSAHQVDPLAHADQAESLRKSSGFDVEADTVVRNFQVQVLPREFQPYCDTLGAAVLCCIVNCLLHHSQDCQRYDAVQLLVNLVALTLDRDAQLLGAFSTMALHCGSETQIFQH